MKNGLILGLLFIIFMFGLTIILAQDTFIYYPTPYAYPDANIMVDDTLISNYYGRQPTSGGTLSVVGTDNGIATSLPAGGAEENPNSICDKLFGEESMEIAGDGIVRAYSKVKFMNFIPDLPKLSIWFDNYLLKEALPYAKGTKTLEVMPGKVPYEIHLLGKTIIEGTLDLEPGQEHTVYLTGINILSQKDSRYNENLSLKITVVREQPLEDSTKAGLSFFNAVPFAKGSIEPINLRIGTTVDNLLPLFSNQDFRDFSNTIELEPGKYLLDIVFADSKTVLSEPLSILLQSGKKYIAIAIVPDGFGSVKK